MLRINITAWIITFFFFFFLKKALLKKSPLQPTFPTTNMLKCDNVVTAQIRHKREEKQRRIEKERRRDIFSAGESNVLVAVVISSIQQISSEERVCKCFQFYVLITAAQHPLICRRSHNTHKVKCVWAAWTALWIKLQITNSNTSLLAYLCS